MGSASRRPRVAGYLDSLGPMASDQQRTTSSAVTVLLEGAGWLLALPGYLIGDSLGFGFTGGIVGFIVGAILMRWVSRRFFE